MNRRPMNRRWYALVAALLFAVQWWHVPAAYRGVAPWVGDAAENLSIGQSLARGRGYRFDWDDAAFRRSFADQNAGGPMPAGTYDRILARRGSYPTLARPPLWPLVLAGLVATSPDLSDVFWRWRLLDLTAAAIAGSLLCGAATAAGGRLAGIAAVVVFLADPVRRANIPAWWSEGLAFDLTAVGCWLLVCGRRATVRYAIAVGATLGLLCLDRSVYVLLVVPLATIFAWPATSRPLKRTGRDVAWIVLVAVAVQVPWWTRNVVVANRFVPLGTQGGFNLPDEYGPAAVRTGGEWDGSGIRDAWLPPDRPAPLPPGWTEARLARMAQGDRRWSILLVDFTCTSTADELAVNAAGTHAALDWVCHHPADVPPLFARKVWALTDGHRAWLAVAAALTGVAFWRSPAERPLLRRLAAWVLLYAAAVGLTHVLGDRFLVPMMPPLYLAVAIGTCGRRPLTSATAPG